MLYLVMCNSCEKYCSALDADFCLTCGVLCGECQEKHDTTTGKHEAANIIAVALVTTKEKHDTTTGKHEAAVMVIQKKEGSKDAEI